MSRSKGFRTRLRTQNWFWGPFWRSTNWLWYFSNFRNCFLWNISFNINISIYEVMNHKLWIIVYFELAQEFLDRKNFFDFSLVDAHFWLDIYSVKISEIGVNLDNPPKTITWRRISKHYCRHRRRFLHVYSWISLTSENCFSGTIWKKKEKGLGDKV